MASKNKFTYETITKAALAVISLEQMLIGQQTELEANDRDIQSDRAARQRNEPIAPVLLVARAVIVANIAMAESALDVACSELKRHADGRELAAGVASK